MYSRRQQGRPLALHIEHYGDVLRTSHWDVLRTSYFSVQRTSVEDLLRTPAEDVPLRYIENHMGTSIVLPLWTSSGCLLDVILPSRIAFLRDFVVKALLVKCRTFTLTGVISFKISRNISGK